MSIPLLILLDPLCVFAAMAATLLGFKKACLLRNRQVCPVRICSLGAK